MWLESRFGLNYAARMSTLKIIERASLSLPREEQRQLLMFLTRVVQEWGDVSSTADGRVAEHASLKLHPDLLGVVGIIPADAEEEEIHEYRLLKHR